MIVQGATGPGIVAHFIHPDDIYDPDRASPDGWDDMLRQFTSMLRFIELHYPWLEWITTTEAAARLRRLDQIGAEFELESGILTVRTRPGLRFRVRLNGGRSITSVEGAKEIYRYRAMPAAIYESTQPTVSILFSVPSTDSTEFDRGLPGGAALPSPSD